MPTNSPASPAKYGLTGIGNAIVDILAPVSEDLLAQQTAARGMIKGSMNLIDVNRARELYALLDKPTEMSGGSAGNTMAAFASFGGKGGYIGKVANDTLGQTFRKDMKEIGVDFPTDALENGAPTAQSMILITPDAQRTMNTYLGACVKLAPADVNEDLIANSEVTYLEGYLFDEPEAKEAFYTAARFVEKHGHKLSLTLSDSFCVNRYRAEFLHLIENHIDILFANDDELKALFETTDLSVAIDRIRPLCELTAVTMGENGSVIVTKDSKIAISAIKPPQLVDTTGAGDAYAAGFLFGLTSGKDLAECGRLASVAATEAISHIGPRPQTRLSDLA